MGRIDYFDARWLAVNRFGKKNIVRREPVGFGILRV